MLDGGDVISIDIDLVNVLPQDVVLLHGLVWLHPLIVEEEVSNLSVLLVTKSGQLRIIILIFNPLDARAELPLALILLWLDTSD